jgi:hypothetical protein
MMTHASTCNRIGAGLSTDAYILISEEPQAVWMCDACYSDVWDDCHRIGALYIGARILFATRMGAVA